MVAVVVEMRWNRGTLARVVVQVFRIIRAVVSCELDDLVSSRQICDLCFGNTPSISSFRIVLKFESGHMLFWPA